LPRFQGETQARPYRNFNFQEPRRVTAEFPHAIDDSGWFARNPPGLANHMQPPVVSVIIPTYRHRDFVLQALDSVFAQTFKNFEVIVVNDGSPDDTDQVLRPLREAGRIKYLEQPNAGHAAARNRGLADASGEFVAFLDDDDLWPPDKLQWQVEVLAAEPTLGVVAGRAVVFEQSPENCLELRPRDRVVTFESLFLINPIWSPGQTLIRTALLKAHNGLSAEVWGADDLDLWMRLSRSTRIEMHPQLALRYRRHGGNSSADRLRMLQNHLKVLKMNLPFVKPDQRKALTREAYLRLYQYLGKQIVDAAKVQAKRGHLVAAFRQLFQLGVCFGWPINVQILRGFVRDLLPRTRVAI